PGTTLPGLRGARVHRVEGSRPVLDVEADDELARVLEIAGAADLDVAPGGDGIEEQDVVRHAGRVPEFAAAVDAGEGVDHDVRVVRGHRLGPAERVPVRE